MILTHESEHWFLGAENVKEIFESEDKKPVAEYGKVVYTCATTLKNSKKKWINIPLFVPLVATCSLYGMNLMKLLRMLRFVGITLFLCTKDEHIMWGCDVTDTGIE